MEKETKTGYEKAQEIVRKIPVNQANFEHIAKSGKINGSLMADLCELLIKVEQDKKDAYSAGLMCERILAKDEIQRLKEENQKLREENEKLKAKTIWQYDQLRTFAGQVDLREIDIKQLQAELLSREDYTKKHFTGE